MWPPSPPTNSRRTWKPLPLLLRGCHGCYCMRVLALHAAWVFKLERACVCACRGAKECVFVCAPVHVCVCLCVHFCCIRACLHPCQLRLLHNHIMQCICNANCTILGGKPRFASSAWLPLVLALLCLLLSPVRSCLLQVGGVGGGRGRWIGGWHPLRSSLQTIYIFRYRPPKNLNRYP